ncbi:MAG: peptidoglycan-binding protein, partial [Rhodobacteraceae bacterium]|nr:peptidoglycan-binding protein [Paracoccaceae bacterium]
MKRLSVLLLLVFLPLSALAQTRWVQIEAQPGWYAIAMGPYTEQLAQETLDLLLSAGAIPRDSFLSTGSNYRQKIWPSNLSNDVTLLPSPEPTSDTSNVSNDTKPESEPISEPEVIAADETPREARETEAALSIEEKKQLQVMLKWAGFYNSTIDGAFGRGTRASMADWQAANNFEVTGVLTTLQR